MTKPIDEEILDLIREFDEDKKGKYGRVGSFEHKIMKQVEKGRVTLEEEIIEFEERKLLEDKISISLPKNFEVMDPELASIKYPSEARPELIITNEETSINITFDHTETPLEDLDVEEFKDSIMEMFKEVYVSAEYIEEGVIYVNGRNIGYFDFIVSALDGDIYNIIFCTGLEGRALMCNFNCTEEEMEYWKPIGKGIINSLEVCSEEN